MNTLRRSSLSARHWTRNHYCCMWVLTVSLGPTAPRRSNVPSNVFDVIGMVSTIGLGHGPTEIMSSGVLLEHKYHRTSQLGVGSFGSVVVVYNDAGDAFALKLFRQVDEPHHGEDDEDESYKSPSPIEIGFLREISALRLLRDANGHENIVNLVDIQTEWGDDEDEEVGAGTNGCLSIALPLYSAGSLQDAIQNGIFRAYPRKVKAAIAHGILAAVAFLRKLSLVPCVCTPILNMDAIQPAPVFFLRR